MIIPKKTPMAIKALSGYSYKIHDENNNEIEVYTLNDHKENVLFILYGCYDIERVHNKYFRWLSSITEFKVINKNKYEYALIRAINNHNKKNTKVFVKSEGNDDYVEIINKDFNIDDIVELNIPIMSIDKIKIISDTFCPYDMNVSQDKRKLSFFIDNISFKKGNVIYNQPINYIKYLDDCIYDEIIHSDIVNPEHDKYFKFQYNSTYIKNKKNTGILLYIHGLNDSNMKCLDNLFDYKHSKYDIPIIIFSDSNLEVPKKYNCKFIKIPNIPKMSNVNFSASNKYGTQAFLNGIDLAKELNYDYYFYYEWDCKIGKDYWYDILLEQHDSWPYESIMTGTPVIKCPLNSGGVGNFLQGMQEYVYNYSKKCGVSMVVEYVYPFALYTNGALTFYNTKKTEEFFINELKKCRNGDYSYIDRMQPWDLEFGIRLFKEYKEKSFEKVGWLESSYSGCGDLWYNQKQRQNMLDTGLKYVIHQHKYGNIV